jgi:hypothetical protein
MSASALQAGLLQQLLLQLVLVWLGLRKQLFAVNEATDGSGAFAAHWLAAASCSRLGCGSGGCEKLSQ